MSGDQLVDPVDGLPWASILRPQLLLRDETSHLELPLMLASEKHDLVRHRRVALVGAVQRGLSRGGIQIDIVHRHLGTIVRCDRHSCAFVDQERDPAGETRSCSTQTCEVRLQCVLRSMNGAQVFARVESRCREAMSPARCRNCS